ncbi:MAG TPA: TolC family protein [Candidatus Polarisedimenticolia bacterium]|nr:TolC family protein [Candidatus Polarisedimenticolia bacterium]
MIDAVVFALALAGTAAAPAAVPAQEAPAPPVAAAPPADTPTGWSAAPIGATVPATGAAAEGEPVGLGEVLRLVRERSPRSDVERARVGIAAAERTAARVHPNPELDFSSTHLTSGTNTGAAEERAFVLGQPLLIFGQLSERKRAADLEVAAAQATTDAAIAERLRQARSAFTGLLAAQERVRILDEERTDLESVSHIVTGRAAAGDKSAYDALRIDLERRAREAELAAARAEVREASGALAILVGDPGWHPVATGELAPEGIDAHDEAALWQAASEKLPALLAVRRESEAARAGIDLAKKERLPVPVLQAGGQFTQDAASDSFVAGLSFGLPVFDRGQGGIARASARSGAAELETAAITAETRADLDRALAVLRERRGALDQLDRDVMGRLPDLRRMSEDAYREGASDILDLLDASRTRAAARQARLDAVEALVQSEIDVLALTGQVDRVGSATPVAPAVH